MTVEWTVWEEEKENSPLRSGPQTKLRHVQFWPNVVRKCSHCWIWGEGWLPAGGAIFSAVGATDRGGWFKVLVFFAKYNQMCGSCQGQRSGAPFGKMRNNQTTEEQLIFFYFFFSSRPTSVRHRQRLFMKSVSARVKPFQVANWTILNSFLRNENEAQSFVIHFTPNVALLRLVFL